MTTSRASGQGGGTIWQRARDGRALPYGLMALTVAVFGVGFWPGHMSNDSIYMIDQASGAIPITDHHAPVLVWLWSLGWPIGLRPGVVMVISAAACLAGAYLLARAAFSRLGASLVAVGAALAPSVFGNLGVVSRDTWFLGFLLLTGGLLVWAQRSDGRLRAFALAGSLVAAFLCLASRQNALAVVAVLLVALVAVVLAPRLRGRRRLVRLGLPVAVGAAIGVLMIAVLAVAVRVGGIDRVHPEQYLYLYDLAGLSVRDGVSHFPDAVYASDDVAPLAQTSSLDSIIPLSFGPNAPIPMPRSAEQVDAMREAWIDEVTGDPRQYLDWRIDAFGRQIGLDAPGVFVYHPGIDPSTGYEIAVPAANDVVTGYQELFSDDVYNNGNSFLHRAWVYLLVALGAAIVLLRSPSGAVRTVGALALGAWTYQVGLFFGTMGTQWRFEFPVAAIAIISVAVAVKTLIDRRAERDPAPERKPEGDEAPPVAALVE
jgi:hypothetical protein